MARLSQPKWLWLTGALLALAALSCGQGPQELDTEEGALEMQVTSPAFQEGGTIPDRYTCDGADLSPPLEWSEPPANTRSLALIADDPDAPGRVWVHWVLYDIPPDTRGLPEGVPKDARTDVGVQGRNDFGDLGYGGPCPPKGRPHRYFFKLYALDTSLGLEPGAGKADVLRAMEGHVLARGQLMGRYQRR